METIVLVVIVAVVFGSAVKALIDRLLGTLDKGLDVADEYLDSVRKEQSQATKLKLAENKLKHQDRLDRINAKRIAKNLPTVTGKDIGLDDI